jgi:hypothetical protein
LTITSNRHNRGPLLILASLRLDPRIEEIQAEPAEAGIDLPEQPPGGGIACRVVLSDCVTGGESGWFCGPCRVPVEDAEPLPFLP